MTQPGFQPPQQASGTGVPSVVKNKFTGADYKNWLKVGMSLKLTAKALTPFCKDEMESFHNSLTTSIGSSVCSTGCTSEDIRKKKKGFTCASNVCHRWLADIKNQCATGQFSVVNTTVSLWSVHPWQLAQYYMGPGQDAANTSPLKTDPGGILQLVINCKRFHKLINKDKVEEVRNVRNLVMHNGDFTFTTADMKKHLQCMTDLLQEPGLHAQPHTDSAANDAIDEIKQIESVDIDINDAATLEFERNMWKELIADQTTNRQEIKKIIKSNEDLKKRLKDVDTELKRDIGAVKRGLRDTTQNVTDLKQQVDGVQGKVDSVQGRVDSVQGKVDNVQGRVNSVQEQVDQLAKEGKDKSKLDAKMVEEKLKKALRDLYNELTMPFQQTVHEVASTEATLDDMFVQLLLQESSTTKLPETPGYRDVEELQRLMQSSHPIQLSQLFDKLQDRHAPRSVLILGRAGIGKSTLLKQMASLWAKEELWKGAVKYLFLITLRELQQDRKWTLADLLLDGLPLEPTEKRVALELLEKHISSVLVVLDGWDEISYQDRGVRQRDGNKKTDLNTMLSSITQNVMMKGAKVIVTSRPNDNVPKCGRKTELYGFTQISIQKYIEKFSDKDTELKTFIRCYLQNNVNIATLCYLPVQCNFVCAYLSDMHSATHSEDVSATHREDVSATHSEDISAASTMTRLYVLATINLAKKHGMKQVPSKEHHDKIFKSVLSHSYLAKHCTMSTPLQIIMYENDLKRFGISEEDRRTGFLAESETKNRAACVRRPCWSFHHLSIQEMFAAVALLLGPHQELLKLVKDGATVRQREVLIKFIVGLWCDPPNKDFMDLVSGQVDPREVPHSGCSAWLKCLKSSSLEPRAFIEKVSRVCDVLQVTIIIYESQCPSFIDLVPKEIPAEKVFPTEMMALSWVLRQPQCLVTKLNFSGLDTNLMMQLCDGLEHNTSIQTLNLSYNEGAFANEEVGRRFGAVLGLTSKKEMRKLHIGWCRVSNETLRNVVDGLCQGCPNMEQLVCWDNFDLTKTSYETLRRLLTKLPGVEIIGLKPWVKRLEDEFPGRVSWVDWS